MSQVRMEDERQAKRAHAQVEMLKRVGVLGPERSQDLKAVLRALSTGKAVQVLLKSQLNPIHSFLG